MKRITHPFLVALVIFTALISAGAQNTKPLTVTDMMKFRQIHSPSISHNGKWVILTTKPDRGDPEVQVCSSNGEASHILKLAEKPLLSNDGSWVAAVQTAALEKVLKLKKGKKLKQGMILLNTASGKQEIRDSVQSFQFSNDNKWLLYHESDSTLVLRSLKEENSFSYNFVTKFAVDSSSRYLAMVLEDSSALQNVLVVADLQDPSSLTLRIYADSSAWVDELIWNNRTRQLAFLAGISGEKHSKNAASLHLWSPGNDSSMVILEDSKLEEGWKVYHTNKLKWSKDGGRLFLGTKPEAEILPPKDEKDSVVNLYDRDEILADRGVDVWHWNDPYISSHQKKQWAKKKDQIYMGVYHLEEKHFVQLADMEMPGIRLTENNTRVLGLSTLPYAKEVTWDGRYSDYYLVDLASGNKRMILEHHDQVVRLSPDGKQLVYYKDAQWYLMNAATLETRCLTEDMDVTFSDEDWDYPEAAPGYGTGGWLESSEAVLIYDKYDIWLFPTSGAKAICLTKGEGRKEKYQFRIQILDPEKEFLESGETVYLSAYHDEKKHTALYAMKAGEAGIRMILEGAAKYTLLGKARDADQILYTRQSYTEFPDLRVGRKNFKKSIRLTDVNPQVADFAWGNASLLEWNSIDGTPLQGILITPDGAKPSEGFPVLVYYYRFFTQRLYDFNQVAVNHRPCFPFYASNAYAIFLPDIRFDVGTPGYSATKCLVPGVQKLIEMRVADPKAICLHGHSWSGYQTAFAITQTNIFTCAIAGAPVSNMTSAYSGIRWESGLARQFQYEKSQSRIGANLWEARDLYIENSPVFFADRISTPLLIQFGDADGAVPWYQGIELYLALRRLEKDCIFLQYRDEGHHLKKYANKLDYTLKFKEYLDHYLKGEPAAGWIRKGIPYTGQ